jgi:ribulose-phosphate 3-epimerase
MEIIPAILVRSFRELQEKISFASRFSKNIHVDFCDGHFVKSETWPYTYGGFAEDIHAIRILNEEEGMPNWDTVDFEYDLMIKDPHLYLDTFIKLGAKKVIIHIESVANPKDLLEFVEGLDMYTRENTEIGLAINTTTDTSVLRPFLIHIDFIQCMGIAHIGRQGEDFDERVFDQIKNIREMDSEILIAVDGSVNTATAPSLALAGVRKLVVGSAVMDASDPVSALHDLHDVIS